MIDEKHFARNANATNELIRVGICSNVINHVSSLHEINVAEKCVFLAPLKIGADGQVIK